jgi:hypothetical protein
LLVGEGHDLLDLFQRFVDSSLHSRGWSVLIKDDERFLARESFEVDFLKGNSVNEFVIDPRRPGWTI